MRLPWKVTAEEEYARDPELKKEDVETLREWMISTPHLPQVDDEMICQFLHACFYDVERTKKTINYYYTYKTTMPELFDNWDPTLKEMQDIINNVLIAAELPEPDNDGYRVLICKLYNTSPDIFNYALSVKWLLMNCIHSLWDRGVEPGFVLVYDSSGFSMRHLFKCYFTNARNFSNFGKNASPFRVVKTVFINASPVIKRMLSLFRPLLNKEILDMMAFYTDPDEYFSTLPKSIVPEDYGGEGPSTLSIHRESVKKLIEAKDYFLAEERIRAGTRKPSEVS